MSVRTARTLLAAGLLVGVLAGCQAPGFMGLNGESAIPGLGIDHYTLARVPIRVMVPAEGASGRHSADVPEIPAEGAKVYLALDPEISARTDSEGIAPLTIPVNGVQLIRAEVRTAAGTMHLEGMMGLPFSREREQASGPNTVSLPTMRELNEPLTLSLASTLVAAHLQERYTPEEIRYLDPMHVLTATREVTQALKAGGMGYQTASIPDLTEFEDVRRLAQELVQRHEKVRAAFQMVFTARVPERAATPSATASLEAEATASVAADATLPQSVAGTELFPLEAGSRATFQLVDAQQQVVGQVVRTLTRVSERTDGVVATGTLEQTVEGQPRQWRFMIKRQADKIMLSMPYRPELTYPLPFADGGEWIPAKGLLAKSTFAPGQQGEPDAWTIHVTGEIKGKPVEWTEVYQPENGLVAFSWGTTPDAPTAQLLVPTE